ncbi:MAG: hypothetical protein KDI55_16465 [Anaerolineae bacterium]|nr:hypothetical protein [Anaerolineae bacterium]MCB0255317.1 hypothetical protein [Anaerolineae bacterium]
MHRRFPFFMLILVVLVGLLVFGGQSRQQEAWTQGYLAGLATAGGQDSAAIPYALAMQNQRSGPGFFGVMIGFGLLALLFVTATRGFRYRMGQAPDGASGDDWMHHWRRHGPWRGCGPERTEARAAPEDPPARQPMPAEPVESMPQTTTQ